MVGQLHFIGNYTPVVRYGDGKLKNFHGFRNLSQLKITTN